MTALDATRKALFEAEKRGRWLAAWEIQRWIKALTGRRYSESGITARIRDLRKAQYGGHRIDERKRERCQSHEYRLIT